jgi:hypothetical protein
VPAGTKEGRAEDDRGTCIIVLGEPHGDGNAYRPINAPFWLLIGGWFFGALMYLSLYVQAPGVAIPSERRARNVPCPTELQRTRSDVRIGPKSIRHSLKCPPSTNR